LLNDDPLYLIRLQAMSAADQLGSVALACRLLDIPRSTFYRWRNQWLQYGREILRPRERRSPRMPNATSPLVGEQILAFALGHPGFGPCPLHKLGGKAGGSDLGEQWPQKSPTADRLYGRSVRRFPGRALMLIRFNFPVCPSRCSDAHRWAR